MARRSFLLCMALSCAITALAQSTASMSVQAGAYGFNVKKHVVTNAQTAHLFSTTVYKGGISASPDPTFLPTLFNFTAFLYSAGDTISIGSPLLTNGSDSTVTVGYSVLIPNVIDRNRLRFIRIQAVENGTVIRTATIAASNLLVGNNYVSSTFNGVGNKELNFRLSVSSNTNSTAMVSISDFAADKIFIVLPVTFYNVSVKKENSAVAVLWKTGNEADVKQYEVERSRDGRSFFTAGVVPANKSEQYVFTDYNAKGKTLYRIRSVDLDGKYQFSSTVFIDNSKTNKLKAFPSPARSTVKLFHDKAGENTIITIYNAAGMKLREKKPAGGSIQTEIELNGLPGGNYFIVFLQPGKNTESTTIIKQ
jgi:hypothetical protein